MNPALSFTIQIPTVYGPMLVNRHDINQTNTLFKTGRAVHHAEIELLAQILQRLGTDLTFVDVGANFGAFTLALARLVGPAGVVHAFEAQRIIFNMLAGSVALNALTRVFCHHAAVGNREGSLEIPQFDYGQALNFGSIEFGPEQREPLNQARGRDPRQTEYVRLTTIDRCALAQVHLIKIDVEGMELEVLEGAAETVRRCRPVVYVEFLKSDKAALTAHLTALNYLVYENEGNLLGIPVELQERLPITRNG